MDKKGGIWLIGLSLGILFFCMSFASAKIDDPVLWYKFKGNLANSGTGTFINGIRGQASNLNGISTGISGVYTISMSDGDGVGVFDGNGYTKLNAGNIQVINDVVTLSVWFKTPDLARTQRIMEQGWDQNGPFTITTWEGNVAVNIRLADETTPGAAAVSAIEANKWYNLIATYDKQYLRLYLNGVEKANTKITGSNKNLMVSNQQVYVGGGYASFYGMLDEAMIFDRTLSASEVIDLYNSQKTSPRDYYGIAVFYPSSTGSSSGRWTSPDRASKITVKVWAGGGGGGGGTSPDPGTSDSGGGGGGGYAERTYIADQSKTYNFNVGAGFGGPGQAGVSSGDNGAPSCFGATGTTCTCDSNSAYLCASGGKGGVYGGTGGAGGWGFNGDKNYQGHDGQALEDYYGSRGGIAGDVNNDRNLCKNRAYNDYLMCETSGFQANNPATPYSSRTCVGADMNNPLIINSRCYKDNTAGGNGYAPGNGGGAGRGSYAGGKGGDGKILIEYTTDPLVVTSQTCTDEQTLFRLFANTNSHVSPYSDTSAPIRICYKDIFGSDYTGTDSHICTSTNKIMGISTATNAHVENPSLANYDAKICYGNLACTLRDNTCGAGESAVASLSSDTNAHIALGTDTAYTKKICCKTGGATGLGVEHRQIYFANTNLNFAYSVTSPTNTVSWIIDEPDGTKITENQQSFTKSFTTAGQRTITITEKDANGIIKAESQMAILIINDVSGVLAFINKPKHKEYISSEELKVDYSATDSYVIKLETKPNENACSGRTIICLAGDCPRETKNSPPGCTNKVPVGGTRGANNYGNTEFNWMFNGPNQRVQGTGNSFATGTQGYSQKGEYRIDLTMKYSANNINIQSLLFQRVFTLGVEGCKNGVCSQCSEDRQWLVYLKADKTEESRRPTSTSLTEPPACAGSDEIIGTKDDCCPAGQECKPAQNGAPAGCYPSNYKSCGDYTTKELCEAGPGKAWETDDTRWNAGGLGRKCGDNWADGLCVYNVVCEKCRWVAEATGNIKKCQLEGKNRPSSDNPLICTPGKPTSVCTYTSTASSACESGFKTVDIDATPQDGTSNLVGVDNCVDRTVTIPCGRAVLELPFFGGWQIAGTLVIILAIYYLIIKKTMRGKRSSHQGRKSLSAIKNL